MAEQKRSNCASLFAAIIKRPDWVSKAPDVGLLLHASFPDAMGAHPVLR